MGAIFQLFSAADLLRLAAIPGKLDELRQRIRDELAPSADVRAKLKDRANQVFRQLASPPIPESYSLPSPTSPTPSQSFPEQLFILRDLDLLDADPAKRLEKRQILEWAIRCERDNSPYVLEVIMQKVYDWFKAQVPPPPLPTSDATYSPFSKEYNVVRALDPPDDLTLVDRGWPW